MKLYLIENNINDSYIHKTVLPSFYVIFEAGTTDTFSL